jgi:hypothetical protein
MTARNRFYVAALLSGIVVLPYYVLQFGRGYVKWNYFPLLVGLVGFSDLPHCPYCDHIGLRSPLLEMAVVSALFFGIVCALLWLKKKT